MEPISVLIFVGILVALWYCCSGSSRASNGGRKGFRGQRHAQFIPDRFTSLDEVRDAIRKAGLESCSLIFGIDYTASNLSQGQRTFGGKSLHHMDPYQLNPYQKVICILGETLEPFDDDGCIPAFGFGDTFTRDNSVFTLTTQGACQGFHGVLQAYNDVTPRVRMAGPTDFAPLIRQAMDIVTQTKSYHILVIVADGQVTSERATTEAIVDASNYPLSIIMVGVGDGPWDTMEDFDDKLPKRRFDNFQFVNFSAVTAEARNPQAAFAMHALMEIPEQYKAIKRLGLLPS
ncbi:hypothetical protein BaRGS_00031954 [Batillaria attramentaria]|uniref:VWFA domain-containing protein n=1 Tax=Batillaria attramentaria TaxID=370345 RepID=A0ABD0JPP1_9CAEN